jgi:2-hydroxychromene-2-carboxylate isomerase
MLTADRRFHPQETRVTRRLECYYDYRSPFPFLATEPVAELGRRHSVAVEWIPIRLPELSSYRERPMGHTFPKRNAYIALDMQRWARRRGVEIRAPRVLLSSAQRRPASILGKDHPLDTEAALRGALVAKHRGVFDAYHRGVNRSLWGEGEDVSREEILARVIQEIGEDPASFRKSIDSEEVAAELGQRTEEADDRGVFGVPTFFVDDEMFWGQDRLDFVEEALANS